MTKDPNELIQYIIVNKDLNMSEGKIAAQVGHVCTLVAVEQSDEAWVDHGTYAKFYSWFNNSQKKIILGAHQKVLEKYEKNFFSIRDNGHTEVDPNSLTAVSLGIMTRAEASPFIKGLQLLS